MESAFIGRQPIMNRNRGILGYRLLYGGASDLQYDPTHEETAIQTPERKLVLQFEEVLGGATGFIEVEIDALNSEFVAALNPKQCVIEIGSLDGYDPKQVKKNSVAICGTDACEATTSRSLLPGSIYPRSSLPAQFDNLVDRGIDLFQGYFYAKHDPESEHELSADRVTIIDLLSQASAGVDLIGIDEAFKTRRTRISVSACCDWSTACNSRARTRPTPSARL